MNYLITKIVDHARLNKAFVWSIITYKGKGVILGMLVTLLMFGPIGTAQDGHEGGLSIAKAASVERSIVRVWVTAYSSTPEETDDTPFITASGKTVHDGIVATNFLPMGTKVQIPEYFGNKVFVVEDRMHPRKINFVDVWMATKHDARHFGIARTDMVVLNN